MKRLLFIFVIALVALAAATAVFAAPLAQQGKPVIAQPEQDAAVRGVVQIVGSATHPQFQRYEIYYARWPVASDQSWIFVGDAHFQQQPLGLLGTWDTRAVPDGAYGLRVRVVKQDGNYIDSDPRRITVANTRLPDTPTPSVTNTPSTPPTPLPPSPTIAVPTVQLLRPTATATSQVQATPILPGGASAPAATVVEQIFSGKRLLEAARTAAMYTLAAFAVVGVFFGVKGVLVWLWHKFRP
ncbi:MAG: hypothetical protein FJ011_04600 [Chloroflexi bacterium]|nr:hypothetical protein [Chloroflexota bacterium]